jgi:hypothetical protein
MELMAVLVIITVLYTMMPDMASPLRGTQLRRARSDVEMLAMGLWGPTRDYHGFVGDIGITNNGNGTILQAIGLDNLLVFPPTGSTYQTAGNVSGVTMGWNGPYAGFEPQALKNDPWSSPWEILPNGQVRSRGPDRLSNTGDELLSPVAGFLEKGTTGTVAIIVRDLEGGLLTSDQVSVKIWMPNTSPSASPKGVSIITDVTNFSATDNRFVYEGVPPGRHLIEVRGVTDATKSCDGISLGSCQGLYGEGVASVIGGSLATVDIQLHP